MKNINVKFDNRLISILSNYNEATSIINYQITPTNMTKSIDENMN